MTVVIINRSSSGENDELIETLTTLANFGCLLFSMTVIPLTFLVLVVLMKERSYSRSPFFTICKIGFIYDIISLLTQLILRTFPCCGLFAPVFTATDFPAKVCVNYVSATNNSTQLTYFLIYFTRTGQALANLFICLNRASAVMLPLQYNKIWSNAFVLPACICFQLCLSLLLGWRAGTFDVHWLRYPRGQLFAVLNPDTDLRVFWRAVFIPVAGLLLLLISLYAGISYQFRSRVLNGIKNESTASFETKQSSSLLYIAVCCVAMEIIYFATFFYAFIYSVNEQRDERIFVATFIFIRNCYSGVPCLLLCLFCSSVRRDLRRFIGCSPMKLTKTSVKRFAHLETTHQF